AVLVVVGEGDAHAAAGVSGDAGALADVFESAVATVAIEGAREAFEVLGMAINADAARGVATVAVVGGGPLGVVDDPEIEEAVAVVVEPARGDGPEAAFDAGLFGDVFEAAIAEISVERVAVDAGDEEVGATVVVVVGGRDAHGVAGSGHAGGLGDVA